MSNTVKESYVPAWTKFGWTPWGYDAETLPPDKSEMFPDDLDASPDCIEQFLQHNEVFKNGLRGTTCHMDSYMTVVDFKALDTALDVLVNTYDPTKDDWGKVVARWNNGANTQIPAKICAIEITHAFVDK